MLRTFWSYLNLVWLVLPFFVLLETPVLNKYVNFCLILHFKHFFAFFWFSRIEFVCTVWNARVFLFLSQLNNCQLIWHVFWKTDLQTSRSLRISRKKKQKTLTTFSYWTNSNTHKIINYTFKITTMNNNFYIMENLQLFFL